MSEKSDEDLFREARELGRKAAQMISCPRCADLARRLERIEVAARAYDAVLSEYCDCPQRDELRAALEEKE